MDIKEHTVEPLTQEELLELLPRDNKKLQAWWDKVSAPDYVPFKVKLRHLSNSISNSFMITLILFIGLTYILASITILTALWNAIIIYWKYKIG